MLAGRRQAVGVQPNFRELLPKIRVSIAEAFADRGIISPRKRSSCEPFLPDENVKFD
jgi:hypothetical protein